MKRSPLKRGKGLNPGKTRLQRTRLKTRGARSKRERIAAVNFSLRFLDAYWCEVCQNPFGSKGIEAHHMATRARCPGHPLLHDTRNRAWLCRNCHDEAHRGLHPHLIKSRDFLDSLTQDA